MRKSCCFIGHRKIQITDRLIAKLTAEIETLTENGVTRFLFGSRSNFNTLCHKLITELKTKYPDVKRIAYDTKSESSVLEEERITKEGLYGSILKKDVHLLGYEEVYKPDIVYVSGKASYIERNQIMIDNSDYCVFYYDENYTPEQRKISAKNVGGLWTSANSGTAIAYQYAKKKGKRVINVFEKSGSERD